jgi:hypothetical protein
MQKVQKMMRRIAGRLEPMNKWRLLTCKWLKKKEVMKIYAMHYDCLAQLGFQDLRYRHDDNCLEDLFITRDYELHSQNTSLTFLFLWLLPFHENQN